MAHGCAKSLPLIYRLRFEVTAPVGITFAAVLRSPHRSALLKDSLQTRCALFVGLSLSRATLYRYAVNKDGLQPRCAAAVCPSLITAALAYGLPIAPLCLKTAYKLAALCLLGCL